jgi:hypothetical protein
MEADVSGYAQNPTLNRGDFSLFRRQRWIEVAAKRAALVGTLELNVFKTRNATVQLLPTTAKEVLGKPFGLQISRVLRTAFFLFVLRKQTDIVAMVNPAQTSGSHGTTNVITLKAGIQVLTCQPA